MLKLFDSISGVIQKQKQPLDFIGIGAQKAGTTWLNRMLAQHPMVWTPFIKEVHYFDTLYLDWSAEFQLTNLRKGISRRDKARGDYRANITRWDRLTGPGRVLYVAYGRLTTEPEKVVRELESYLSLSTYACYEGLEERVFATPERKIDQGLVGHLEEMLREQYEFLEARFSRSFTSQL